MLLHDLLSAHRGRNFSAMSSSVPAPKAGRHWSFRFRSGWLEPIVSTSGIGWSNLRFYIGFLRHAPRKEVLLYIGCSGHVNSLFGLGIVDGCSKFIARSHRFVSG
jgi:hypothetical protein